MLKKLMINLQRRKDRVERFDTQELYIEIVKAVDGQELEDTSRARPNWRDPFKNRRMTKGEYACFESHERCWEIVAAGDRPVLILEDDIEFTEHYNEDAFLKRIDTDALVDIVLLGHNENLPDKARLVDDTFVRPAFPYNAHAYCISPRAARKLLQLTKQEGFGIIPVDDWFSELLKDDKLDVLATRNEMVVQLSRELLGSDIEPTGSEWLGNYAVHVLTCGTDRAKCAKLYDSADVNGIQITNLGSNKEWRGTDMQGAGGGHKINFLREGLEHIPDTDLVLFTDAYDVFYYDNLEEIVKRYHELSARVVFGAEKVCWPDPELTNKFPEADTEYRFLNSGTFIGEAGTLKRMIQQPIKDDDDDQLYMQKIFLQKNFDIRLDTEGYIFQTHCENATVVNGQVFNPDTNCFGCIYHGNGGTQAKEKFEGLYEELFSSSRGFHPPATIRSIGSEMLEVDFVSREWCEKLIALAEEHGGWEPLPGDLFPAQEIRLSELGVLEEIEEFWTKHIVPVVEGYWKPMRMYGIRDAFIMKYTKDTQKELSLHTDASLVTGSIKLNDDYEGGQLVFPRQGVSNVNTPVGKCILFPGMVTHGHECLELKAGTKYSLTIWSQRFEGDSQT